MSHSTISKEIMAEFANLLADHLGLDYPSERWGDLEKRLLRIMLSFGFQDPTSCLEWLKQKPLNKEQIALLAQHLTIGETYFFRDSRTFSALKEKVLPSILKRHQTDRNVRIWSAGCCSGEEPYSIAILLHQLIPNWKNWNICILGTDINLEFLKKAEQGIYKKWSFRATPTEILKTYFKQQGDSYIIMPEIKKSVSYSYLNLAENTYPSVINQICELDLILCHNVLIYFSQNQIKKIIDRLLQALNNQAWLSMSAIEIPLVKEKHLILQHFSGAFFFQKEVKRKETQLLAEEHKFVLEKNLPPVKEKAFFKKEDKLLKEEKKAVEQPLKLHIEKNVYEKCLHLNQHKQYKEVVSELLIFLLPHQKESAFILEHLKEVILLIHVYANQGDLVHALEWVEIVLKMDKLNPILHYLHAMILNSLNDISTAIKSLKHALFLDHNFVTAHYMLGTLEQKQKNDKAALRHFKIALELLQNYQEEEILPGTEDLTANYLKDLLLNIVEK